MKKVLDGSRIPTRAPFNTIMLHVLMLVVFNAHAFVWFVVISIDILLIIGFVKRLKDEQHVDIFED